MTLRGLFLTLGVIAVFLAIFVPLAFRIQGGTKETLDAERLRRVYVAISLYEMSNNGTPPPNLSLVLRDLDPLDLQSVADPLVTSTAPTGGFSLDGAIANYPIRSKTRVSWSYRWHWPNAGNPEALKFDVRRGLIASWWSGSVQTVNMDGSIASRPATKGDQPTFAELFGK